MMIKLMATGELNVFSPSSISGYVATAILTIVGFLITVFILKLLLYKPLLKMIHTRQDKMNTLIQETEQQHSAAIEKQKQLDAALIDAQKSAGDLLAKAREQALRQQETILDDAKLAAKQMIEKAQQEREQLLQEDKARIYSEAVNLAVQAVGSMAAQRYTTDEEWQKMRAVLTDYVEKTQANELEHAQN